MLVVVEDRNVTFLFQLALDLKAARCGDVLQVDAAEGAGDQADCVYKLVHIMRLDAKRERIHIAERLKEHAFALHDRHTGFRADVTEAENGGADVLLNLQTGLRDAGGVGEAQIVLRLDRHSRGNFDFPLPFAVQTKGFLCIIHRDSPYFHTGGRSVPGPHI